MRTLLPRASSNDIRASRWIMSAICSFVLLTGLAANIARPEQAKAASSVTWTALSDTGPSPRTGASLAALPSGEALLFGGLGASGLEGDTWLWNGSEWTQLTPSASPGPREFASMAYDPSTNEVLLFGGENASGALRDTWIWNVATSSWSQPAVSAIPVARYDAAVAWDPTNSRIDMFGGTGATGDLNDFWTWTGSAWDRLSTGTGTAPAARHGAGLSYSGTDNTMILFGGDEGSTPQSDTWTWSGGVWKEQSPATVPGARFDASMAYDFAGSTAVLYGGATASAPDDDMWAWMPASGANPGDWIALSPASSPGQLEDAATTWDPETGSVMVFGGSDGTSVSGSMWQFQSPPGSPPTPTATAGVNEATVSWSPGLDGGSGLTSQVVTSAPDGITATVSGTATSATVSGLSPNTSYRFTVTASNALGTGLPSSESVAVKTPALPTAPQDVTATPGNGEVSLTWEAPASSGEPVTGYTVTPYSGGTAGTSQQLGPSAYSTMVTGLANGTAYNIHVTATSSVGTGPSGNSGSVTPATVPDAPTDLAVSPGDDQAGITWKAPADGGSAITSYTITPTDSSGNVGSPTVVAAPATSATVTGLTDGTAYTLSIVATNEMGSGAASVSPEVTPEDLIDPPTNIHARPGNTEATISWTPPTYAYVASYTITPYIGTTAQPSTSISAPATSVTVTGLTNLSSYTFVVTAVADDGTTASGTSNAVTPAEVPGAPVITGYSPGTDSATISWTAPANDGGAAVTSYSLQAYVGGIASGSPVRESKTATSATIAGLTPETTYTFGIVAKNDIGSSPSAMTGDVEPYTVPGAPQSIAASAGSVSGTADVSWSPPSDDGGSAITSYTAQAYIGSAPVAGTASTVSGTTTATTLSGLAAGTTYTIEVTAENAAGSGPAGTSNSLMLLGVPTAPTSLSVEPDDGALYVTWGPPSSDGGSPLTGYVVSALIGGTAVAQDTLGPTATIDEIGGLTNGTSYVVTVAAINENGTGADATSEPTAPASEPAPQSDAYSSYVLASSPSFYYRFDEPYGHVAQDDSGNGENLQYAFDRILGSPGALALTDTSVTAGTDMPVVSGPVSGFPSTAGGWSQEVWMEATADGELESFGGSAPGSGLTVSTEDGGTVLVIDNGETEWDAELPYSVTDGNWHLVGLSYDGSTLTLSVDGFVAGTASFAVTLPASGGAIAAGFVSGESLDEFAYYPNDLPDNHYAGIYRMADGESACSTGTLGTYGTTVLSQGAVLYYPMDDPGQSLADGTGQCDSGVAAYGTTTADPGGPSGGGVSGTGSPALAYGQGYAAPQGTSPWTVETWINTSAGSGGLVSWGTGAGSSVNIDLADNGTQITVGNGSSGATIPLPFSLSTDTWHDVAVSFDGTNVTVYADGIVSGTAPMTFDTDGDTSPVVLGEGLAGTMSDVSFYGSALTAGEVSEQWTEGGSDSCPAAPTDAYGEAVVADGASEFYRLDEMAGEVALDSSGNCYSGAYEGNPEHDTASPMATGGSVALDGSQVVVGSSDGLESGNSPFTAEVWVNTTDESQSTLFSFGGNGADGVLYVVIVGNANGTILDVTTDSQTDYFTLPYSITDGSWHMVDVSYDANGNIDVYVDGQEVGSQGLPLSISLPGNGLQLGTQLTGNLADFSYTPSGLNADQIANHWLASTGSTGCPAAPTDAYGDAVVADGASEFYRLDEMAGEVALDSSGNCYSGAYEGNPEHDTASPMATGGSVALDGSQVVVGSSDGLESGNSPFTAEVWVNTTDESQSTLFSFGGNGADGVLYVVIVGNANGTILDVTTDSQSDDFTLPYSITDGSWHMVDVSYDANGNIDVYIDGQEVGSQGLPLSVSLPGNGLQLGSGLIGNLADFSYTPSGLNADQIANHWLASTGRTGCPASPTDAYGEAVVADGASEFYRLDEMAGEVALDSSGNCYSGAYEGNPEHDTASPMATGGSVALDGSQVVVGSSDGLESGNSPFTAEVWVNTTDENQSTLFSFGGNGADGVLYVVIVGNANGTILDVGTDSQSDDFTLPYSITDGSWHMVDVSYDANGNIDVYVDGQEVGSQGLPLSVSLPGNGLQLGSGLIGNLADFSYTPSGLNADQIANHWLASTGSTGCPAAPTDAYGDAVVADGASEFYRLDEMAGEVALDSSGNCYSGAYEGNPEHDTASPMATGGSVALDGSQVVVGSSDGLESGNSPFTAEVWVNTTDESQSTLFSFGGNGADGVLYVVIVGNANGTILDVTTDSQRDYFTLPYSITDGSWHMVDVSYDANGNIDVYVDGQEVGSQGLPLSISLPGSGLELGAGLIGNLADFSYTPSGLNADQIDEHWNLASSSACGTAGTTAYSHAIMADSPTTYYPLDEDGGPVAMDVSGNCHNGSYGPVINTAGAGPIASAGPDGTSVDEAAPENLGEGSTVVGSTTGLVAGNGARSFVTFVDVPTLASPTAVITYGDIDDGAGFQVQILPGDELEVTDGGSASATFPLPYPADDSQWHQIAVTFDGTDVTAYLDGTDVGTAPLTLSTEVTGYPYLIGGDLSDSLPFHDAYISEVAAFPQSLGQAQISSLWSASGLTYCGSAPTDPYGETAVAQGASEFYRLDETTGRVAMDSSGGCFDGAYAVTSSHGTSSPTSVSGSVLSSGSGPAVAGSSEGLESGNSPFTAEVWVNTMDENQSTLFSFGGNGGDGVLYVVIVGNANGTILNVTTDSQSDDFTLPYSITDGSWHMVDVSYDANGNIDVYIDGQEVGSQGLPLSVSLPGSGLQLGAGLLGNISDFAYYPYAKSASEISALWTAAFANGCGTRPSDSYTTSVLADSPVAFYPLGDTGHVASNDAGSCDSGAYATGTSHSASGFLPDTVAATAGSTGMIAIAPASEYPSGSSDRTMEAWVATTSSGSQTLLAYGDLAGGDGVTLGIEGGSTVVFTDGVNSVSASAPAPLDDGYWHEVAASYAGGEVTFYVDGEAIGTESLTLSTIAADAPVYIGGDPLSATPLIGTEADVAVFPTALGATGIEAQEYEAGHAVCGSEPRSGYGAAVIANQPSEFYQLDDASGVALDTSGNCRNGAYASYATHSASSPISGGGSVANGGSGPAVAGSSDGLGSGNSPFTAEIWVNTMDESQSTLFSFGGNGGDGVLYVVIVGNANGTILDVTTDSQSDDFTLPYSITDGSWHMVDVSYDASGNIDVYVDGQEVGSQGLPLSVVLPGSGLQLGSGLVGNISDFAYYPSALTASAIDATWRTADPDGSCPAAPTTGYAAVIYNDHPSTFYELGDSGRSATDYSGNCDTGAYASTAVHSANSAVLSGNGSAEVSPTDPVTPVVLGSSSGLTNVFSAEMWIDTTNDNQSTLFDVGGNGGDGVLSGVIAGNADGTILIVTTDSQADDFTLPYSITDGNWHLIDIVYDGADVTAYVDGYSAGTQALPLSLSLPGQGFQIGASGFTGNVADVAIYSYPLTYYQVARHFDAREDPTCGADADGTYGSVVLGNSPATFLQFGEDDGPEANDASGHCTPGRYGDDVEHGSAGGPVADGPYITSNGGGGVLVTEGAPVMTAGGPWTVEEWTNFTGSPTFTLWSDTTVAVSVSNGTYIDVSDSSTSVSGSTGYPINDGQWHLVTIRYADPGVGIYIDGQLISFTPGMTLPDATTGYSIGEGLPAEDALADFAVYPSALSSTDIDNRWLAAETGSSCSGSPSDDSFGYAGVVNKSSPIVNYELLDSSRAAIDSTGHCHTAAYDPNVSFGEANAGFYGYATGVYTDSSHNQQIAPVIAVASDDDLPSGSSPLTIEAMIEVNAPINGVQGGPIAMWGSDFNNIEFELVGNNKLELLADGGTNYVYATSQKPLVPGTTYPVAVTVDSSGNVTFYIGGSYSGPDVSSPQTISLDTVTPGNGLYIGGDGMNGTNGFNGSIGHFAIAGTALSSATIYQQYEYAQSQIAAEVAAQNGSQGSTTSCSCDPVNTSSGAYTESVTDVSVPGLGAGLDVTRSYASSDSTTDSAFGYGWSFNYGMHLSVNAAAGTAIVTQENGAPVGFYLSGSSWVAPPDDFATLVENADGTYTFTRKASQIFTFDSSGNLTAISDLAGDTTTLQYSGGELASVTDPSGRQLTFTWTGDYITAVTDPAGRTTTYGYDGAGNLTSVTYVNGGTSQYTYDGLHDMLTNTDPDGKTVTNVYNDLDQVVSQTDGAGNTTTMAYSPDQTLITDPEGNVTVDAYNGEGELASQTVGAGTAAAQTTTYTYNSLTKTVSTMTDPMGGVTSYTYDALGSVLSVTDPEGNTTTTTYNAFEEPVTVRDPLGITTTSTYNALGSLTSISTPTGTGGTAVQTFSYDDPSQPQELTSVSDPLGRTTDYGYDSYGNLTSVTDPDGDETTYTYDILGRVTSEVSPDGNVAGATPSLYTTAWTYSPNGRTVTQTDPDGGVTTETMDADGNLVSLTDPDGNVTTVTYNGDSEPETETLPGGSTREMGYNADGEVVSSFDGERTTTYSYNQVGELVSTEDAEGDTTSYAYDPNGDETSVTNADGETETMTYDADGNVTSTTLPGSTVTTGYDADGRAVSTTDGDGNTTTMTYDDAGQVLTTTNALDETTSNTYDLAGELVKTVDPMGNATTFSYNGNGELLSTTDPNGITTSAAYDADGNEISSTDGEGNVTRYSYNPMDELASTTNPLGETTSDTYDADGNLMSTTAPSGTVTGYAYTGEGQVASVSYSDGTPSVSYSYNPDGTVSSMEDGTGTTSYDYNGLGELSSETDGNGNTVSYSYTPGGKLATETYPGDHGVSYGYNQDGEESSVTDWLGNETTFSYDAAGNMTQEAYPNGVTASFGYDAANDLTSITDTKGTGEGAESVLSLAYAVNADGEITGDTESGAGAQTQSYTYDPGSRLETVNGENYSFDNAGNLTTMPEADGTASTLSYNAGDELTNASDSEDGTSTSYSYDANGDRTQSAPSTGGTSSYSYNGAGELDSVSAPGLSASYTYNGNGERMTKTVNGVTTDETWDAAGNIVDDGVNEYVYGPGGVPVEQVGDEGDADTPVYLLQDAAGSTRVLTGSDGTVVGTYAYGAYGAVTEESGSVTTPLEYDGQYTDAGTGFQYDRARYYDPSTASFLTVDPALALTGTPYAFANGDPVNEEDPSGLSSNWFSNEWNTLKRGAGRVWCATAPEVEGAVKQVLPAAAGFIAGGVCDALTGGVGSAICVEAGFIVSGAVGGALECPSNLSETQCVLSGAAAGALSGAAFIATDGGSLFFQGFSSGFVNSAVTQELETGTINWTEAAISGGLGGILNVGTGYLFGGSAASSEVGETSAGPEETVSPGESTGGEPQGGEEPAAPEEESSPTSCTVPQSFTPSTKVELADGKFIPISSIKVGDKVLATDTTTGKTTPETVTATDIHDDNDLMDLVVTTAAGDYTIHTTDLHPIWDVTTHSWTLAENLKAGDALLTNDGAQATVDKKVQLTGSRDMWDLTVSADHDFYIYVGDSNVLVHNDDCVDLANLDPSTVGTPGTRPSVRVLLGGRAAAQNFFDRYSQGGVDTTPTNFGGASGGQQVTLPDGTVINIRYMSRTGDPAVSVNNSYGYWKIHFG